MVSSCRTLTKVPLPNLLIEKVDEQSGIFCMSKNDIKNKTELKRCSHTTSNEHTYLDTLYHYLPSLGLSNHIFLVITYF